VDVAYDRQPDDDEDDDDDDDSKIYYINSDHTIP
jgi:hypothetical protein